MWNSGGKNVWSKVGRSMFGGTKVEGPRYAVPGLFPTAQAEGEQYFKDIPALSERLGQAGEDVWSGAQNLDVEYGEDALRRRMRDAVMPGLAARGLATGGQGIVADVGVEEALAQQRFERAAKRQELLSQASQGLAILKSLPFELRQKLLQTIIGQGGTAPAMQQESGWWNQLFQPMNMQSSAQAGSVAAMLCWVADELYGKDDLRTYLARKWANSHDNAFTRLYRKYGRAWAAFIHKHAWIKPIVRPVWDYMWKQEMRYELSL